MNDKIKKFSFGEKNFEGMKGRRTPKPQLLLAFVSHVSAKNQTLALTVTVKKSLMDNAGWMARDTIDLIYDPETCEGMLYPDVKGKMLTMTSKSVIARARLKYPIPAEAQVWDEPRPICECTEIECNNGKIAFKMEL